MKTVTLSAHFDGEHIVLEDAFPLPSNARLLVTVLPEAPEGTLMEFRRAWDAIAADALARAYGPDEPEYDLTMLKERNPEYEAR